MAVGRYAPSPSGDLHVGNLRTALLAWLFAAHTGSELRLRIDDLDPVARDRAVEQRQLDDLAAIGVVFDGPVLRQSDRDEVYLESIDTLASGGLLYPCYCSRRDIREAAVAPHEHLPRGAYPGTCRELSRSELLVRAEDRPAALRIRADSAEVTFTDAVHGTHTGVVDDFVVKRNDGVPSYNLATVVDDAALGVEQVVRGDDLLAGTARQIWLRRHLGLADVEHGHVPLVVGSDGVRLAKRHGAVTLTDLHRLGESADSVRSRLAASLDLARPGEQVTVAGMLERFDPRALPTRPTVWPDPAAVDQKNASEIE